MQIIIRPMYSLIGKAKVNDEMNEDALIWTDALENSIPIKRLKECWQLARDRYEGDYAPNFYDVKKAWRIVQAQDAQRAEKQTENNPILRCTNKNRHFIQNEDDRGETIAFNFYSDRDELMPCAHCRLADLSAWKKDQIARYGEIAPNPIKPIDATPKISRVEEVYLPMPEAIEIVSEYNGLVMRLVDDTEARKNLYIEFNEGANRFHYQNRSVPLFTADYMRNIIADYKKRVEVKENV